VLLDQGEYDAAQSQTETTLAFFRRQGDRRGEVLALASLGSVASARGEFATAWERLGESLAVQRELADTAGIAFVLERFAGLAAARRQHARATRLAGAAAALRESVGSPLPPASQVKLDGQLSPARKALGDLAFAEAWAAGRAMSINEAIACALRPVDDPAGRAAPVRASLSTPDAALAPIPRVRAGGLAALATEHRARRK
jgi:hypothetical protein